MITNESKLNDLVRELILSKQQAELAGLRQLQWNFLTNGTRISIFRKKYEKLSGYYRM